MIIQLLILFAVIAVVLTAIFTSIILYHFKRFGFPAEPDTKNILHIFRLGTVILVVLNLYFLFLNFISK